MPKMWSHPEDSVPTGRKFSVRTLPVLKPEEKVEARFEVKPPERSELSQVPPLTPRPPEMSLGKPDEQGRGSHPKDSLRKGRKFSVRTLPVQKPEEKVEARFEVKPSERSELSQVPPLTPRPSEMSAGKPDEQGRGSHPEKSVLTGRKHSIGTLPFQKPKEKVEARFEVKTPERSELSQLPPLTPRPPEMSPGKPDEQGRGSHPKDSLRKGRKFSIRTLPVQKPEEKVEARFEVKPPERSELSQVPPLTPRPPAMSPGKPDEQGRGSHPEKSLRTGSKHSIRSLRTQKPKEKVEARFEVKAPERSELSQVPPLTPRPPAMSPGKPDEQGRGSHPEKSLRTGSKHSIRSLRTQKPKEKVEARFEVKAPERSELSQLPPLTPRPPEMSAGKPDEQGRGSRPEKSLRTGSKHSIRSLRTQKPKEKVEARFEVKAPERSELSQVPPLTPRPPAMSPGKPDEQGRGSHPEKSLRTGSKHSIRSLRTQKPKEKVEARFEVKAPERSELSQVPPLTPRPPAMSPGKPDEQGRGSHPEKSVLTGRKHSIRTLPFQKPKEKVEARFEVKAPERSELSQVPPLTPRPPAMSPGKPDEQGRGSHPEKSEKKGERRQSNACVLTEACQFLLRPLEHGKKAVLKGSHPEKSVRNGRKHSVRTLRTQKPEEKVEARFEVKTPERSELSQVPPLTPRPPAMSPGKPDEQGRGSHPEKILHPGRKFSSRTSRDRRAEEEKGVSGLTGKPPERSELLWMPHLTPRPPKMPPGKPDEQGRGSHPEKSLHPGRKFSSRTSRDRRAEEEKGVSGLTGKPPERSELLWMPHLTPRPPKMPPGKPDEHGRGCLSEKIFVNQGRFWPKISNQFEMDLWKGVYKPADSVALQIVGKSLLKGRTPSQPPPPGGAHAQGKSTCAQSRPRLRHSSIDTCGLPGGVCHSSPGLRWSKGRSQGGSRCMCL
ncbi:titin-like [Cuculus canorus]|uniref:titin-like n=1 Tax=Cuculus canorus TaxID=55661 RepID=UPI0023AB047F|nr:titin-like [Cuculus canorus]